MTKKSVFITLVARCGILLFIWMLADKPALADPRVRFKLVEKYLIVVPLTVNGQGPFEFLLDTGTNTSIIERSVAQHLRLRPHDRIELMTVSGPQVLPRARLDSVVLGSALAENLEALITDLGSIRTLHYGICGVLGQNFLSQFNYLLDYREKRIEFEADCDVEHRMDGTRLPFSEIEGLIAVSGQSASSKAWRLVLDSASEGLILFGRPALASDFEISHTGIACLATTIAGHKEVEQGRLRTLRIGELILADMPVTLMPPDGRAEDGLLPMSLFRVVYVNHKQHYVILKRN
jgi:predicted aspartyl protease